MKRNLNIPARVGRFAIAGAVVVTVDCEMPFGDQLIAARYDFVDRTNIQEVHFPIKGRGKKNITVLLGNLEKPLELDDDKIINEVREEGYRPQYIEELFATNRWHPQIHLRFRITALGSATKIGCFDAVPYSYGADGKPGITIGGCGCPMPTYYYHGLVRE